MRRTVFHVGVLLACLSVLAPGFARPAFAQQGHPLTGTWNGDWGIAPTQRTQVTIVMTWDGKNATGVINPGPDSANASIFLDVINWTVRIEADMKDASGKPAHVLAEGKMEDIGAYHRTISGTWKQGTVSGTLKLTRD